ncbi:hypothetical protein D3C73_758830 [compost metagenome]
MDFSFVSFFRFESIGSLLRVGWGVNGAGFLPLVSSASLSDIRRIALFRLCERRARKGDKNNE